jgi:hypothetical protein
MVGYIFQKIARNQAVSNWTSAATSKESRDWHRKAASEIKKVSAAKIMSDKDRLTNRMNMNSIGRMFLFFYDPKTKDELPFYDTFPLIFPIEMYKDGFLGINLHYLPHILRARLMNALYDTLNNKNMNDTTKLKVSYRILKGSSRFKLFTPCIKRYLFSHVRSRYFYVKPEEWDMALMLPLERFNKATRQKVFADSVKKI